VSIHHLQLWVPDLDRATRSWGWLLEQLGYEPTRSWPSGAVWRDGTVGIVIEASPDMVPGMLHSRLRPGMNHVAFNVTDGNRLTAILAECGDHGWTMLADHAQHPVVGDPTIAYLEDQDGFEVELITPS
jgi:catechol 2,3-dioxygenase-like lactoylglutathione lyase family enzyme